MNNGGPAYPVHLRDFFAAHAPEPWSSYEPVFDEPAPRAKGWDVETQGSFGDGWNAWERRHQRAYEEQWPYYYADVMLREREGGQDE
jgi:hypothetical protein